MQNLMDKTLNEIMAEIAVTVAITADILQEQQRDWAKEYYKRDPEGFRRYTQGCPNRPSREPYIAHLQRRIEKLEAENAGQLGAIKAANETIIDLHKALKEEVLSKDQQPPYSTPQPQLPQWKSHKVVEADKIIQLGPGFPGKFGWHLACGSFIIASDQLKFRVPENINPLGGYYVRYEDGYESWSPAEAFEKGYTRLP